ncbi:4016_t:CDS:10 [Acaulospora colombiana]|uniref:4016_t:CDS:1 n=1 Tax=Acaulospora colombiana TaxID=27376 RepID=A0ACA9JX00_9GLOM|nr:4016_t:CDS:10 [Acaulospora colombiana]
MNLTPSIHRTLSNLTSSGYLTFPEFALAMYLTNLKLKGQELPAAVPDSIRNEVLGIIDQIKAIEQKQQQQQLASQAQKNILPQPQMVQQYGGMSVVPNVGQYAVTPSVVTSVGAPIVQDMTPFAQRMMPQQNPPQQYSTAGLQGNAKISWVVTPEEKIQYRTIFRQWDSTGLGYLDGKKAREILSQSGLPESDLMQIWNLSDPNNNGKLNQDEFAVAMHLIYRRLNGYDIPATLPPELIPPSTRDLAESVNQLKNLLTSEVHASQAGLGSTSGSQYVKSRSFTSTPVVDRNDAVVYKHKDDEVGYVSAARRRVPPVSRSASSSFSSTPRSTFSESIGEDSSNKLSEALSDTGDLKYKIKELQRKIEAARDSNPEWLSREYNRNSDDLNSLLEQHRDLDYDLNKMLSNAIPDIVYRARKISSKVSDSKLELFKIRDERTSWRSYGYGGSGYDPSASRRIEEETARIKDEKASQDRLIEDIERKASKLRDYMVQVSRDREEIEEKLRQFNRSKDAQDSETKKWEDGIGVSEEVRLFIEDLKRDERRTSSRSEYSETRFSSSTGDDTYKRPTSTNSVYISSSSSPSSSKAKTPEEREAFIKAEAKRMLQERLEKIGKLLAEKQEKAEKEAERLRKMEEFERREEERRNQFLSEAREMERTKIKKAQDKEEAARAMELELERRRLAEVEREKRQQEERLARIKREAEERKAEEERRRLEQEALIENSRAARERAKQREEEAKKLEEIKRRDTEILAKSKKEETNLQSKVPEDSEISSSPVEPISNNPFLKFGKTSQDQSSENVDTKPLESTNPFYKFTTGTSTGHATISREAQEDNEWSVIDRDGDSSDDDVNIPVGNAKNLAAKLFGSIGFPQMSQPTELSNSESKRDISSPPEISSNNTSKVINSTSSSTDVPNVGHPSGIGEILSGSVPNNKSGGGIEMSRSVDEERPAVAVPRQRSFPKPDRRTSTDWFGSLASDQLAGELKVSAPPQVFNSQTTIKDENGLPQAALVKQAESSTTVTSAEDDVDFSQEFRVKSMFPYFGNGDPDSLQFESGAVFRAHPSKNESNAAWWYGVIEQTGAKGWFPKTYVEPYSEETEICKARVLYEWKAQNSEELDIKPGIVVSILDKSLGSWWKAEYEGAKGIIPANYVEEISSSSVHDKTDEAVTSEVEKTDDATEGVTDEGVTSEDDTSEDDTSEDDTTSEDETNESDGECDQKSVTSNPKENEMPFNSVPIEIPRFNILSERSPDHKKSSASFEISTESQMPLELARSPSPTRLFGSSPITPVFWMHGGTDSKISPSALAAVKPDGSGQGPSASSWADLKIGEDLTKEERRRQEAIYELIFTEQTYLRDLQMIVEVFYGPMQDLLPKNELEMIFSNIEDILLHNTAILSDLEQRQKEEDYIVKSVGDVLVKHSAGLRLYVKYCGNQMNASKFIQKKREEDKRIEEFLKRCQQNPKCGSLDLCSFLLKPLQRITRYPLLIRQILHYTGKDNEDHRLMMEALHKAEKVLEETNEAAREQENKNKLSEIANLIDLERLEEPIPLNEIFVKDVGPDDTCFQVIHIADTINLRAANASMKRQWVNQLETASGYCLTKERQAQRGESTSAPADHISGTLRVLVYEGILPEELHGESDKLNNIHAYCQVQLNRQIFKTKIVKGTISPHWNQYLMFSVTTLEDVIKVSVLNYDKYTQDEYLGQAEIGLRFLKHYGDNETEKITLGLKPSGGSISIYLSYKATF